MLLLLVKLLQFRLVLLLQVDRQLKLSFGHFLFFSFKMVSLCLFLLKDGFLFFFGDCGSLRRHHTFLRLLLLSSQILVLLDPFFRFIIKFLLELLHLRLLCHSCHLRSLGDLVLRLDVCSGDVVCLHKQFFPFVLFILGFTLQRVGVHLHGLLLGLFNGLLYSVGT